MDTKSGRTGTSANAPLICPPGLGLAAPTSPRPFNAKVPTIASEEKDDGKTIASDLDTHTGLDARSAASG
jgi:hypothetical protein